MAGRRLKPRWLAKIIFVLVGELFGLGDETVYNRAGWLGGTIYRDGDKVVNGGFFVFGGFNGGDFGIDLALNKVGSGVTATIKDALGIDSDGSSGEDGNRDDCTDRAGDALAEDGAGAGSGLSGIARSRGAGRYGALNESIEAKVLSKEGDGVVGVFGSEGMRLVGLVNIIDHNAVGVQTARDLDGDGSVAGGLEMITSVVKDIEVVNRIDTTGEGGERLRDGGSFKRGGFADRKSVV